ncbi:flavin monoamine oxidase family protein [Leucobacter chromiireducens]|uniref:FAD-dependent oxidoreductase n=1 Tax=Leucobacter chromiireducens subsp. chromiireducens TaxID=660067 RepID=A0ABS1SPX2_9MICO|nr:NAD(P)/FAD-dependent oxidoreductase [Leucobacter chromiireducens]MBL3690228.1 FAD-dependent oxidoreductase [Leucobacter chromiireducens subsp. chromiireducens]
MDVLVVGAGLAGLTAAWELEKAGHRCTVLEARDRVGGRTWSERLGNGEVTERGGEYIFPTEFAIRRLAAEVGVPIMSHNVRYGRRTVTGRIISFAELSETSERVRATLSTMIADGEREVSLERAFAEALGTNYRLDPVYRRTTTSAAADPARVSAEAVLLHESSTVDGYIEDGGRFVGGNQALSIELARRLGDRVRLESPVQAVDQSESGVQVTLSDGTRLEADAAVISVPLPLLRELELGFALPEAQQRALDHRFMGVAAKLGIPFSRVDDDIALQNPEHTWWSWRSLSIDGVSRINALSSFAGGPFALDALNVTAGSDGWVAALRAMRPELEIDGDVLLTTWADDPWARGSYSAPGLEWAAADATAFNSAAGRVAIAGEHTGLAQSLSGAVASGVRAAAALIQMER